MTKQHVISCAENKKYKVEVVESTYYTWIGICKGKHVWHWFKSWKDDDYVVFDHSYSQNNGTSKKGYIHGMKIEKSLNLY